VSDDVEAGAFLIANYYSERILKFFAKANVKHAGVERTAPHADVEPAGARERSGYGTWEYQVGGGGEHDLVLECSVSLDSIRKLQLVPDGLLMPVWLRIGAPSLLPRQQRVGPAKRRNCAAQYIAEAERLIEDNRLEVARSAAA
jgi:hypothetical protein